MSLNQYLLLEPLPIASASAPNESSQTENENSPSEPLNSESASATPVADTNETSVYNEDAAESVKESETAAASTIESADNESAVEKEACDTPRTGTPHEESDFEDNITVTVPTAQMQSNSAFHDRHINGRHSRYPMRPPGLDTPPKMPHLLQHRHSHDEEASSSLPRDDKESFNSSQEMQSKHGNQDNNHMNQYGMPSHSMQNHQPPSNQYDNHHYAHQQQQMPHGPPMQPHRGMPPNQYPGPMSNQMQMPSHYDPYGMPMQHNQK